MSSHILLHHALCIPFDYTIPSSLSCYPEGITLQGRRFLLFNIVLPCFLFHTTIENKWPTLAKREANTQIPSQMCKSWLVMGFGENVSQLSLGSIWHKSMSPFLEWSWRMWKRTSMCLGLECSTGFLATLMALVLSQSRCTWWKS